MKLIALIIIVVLAALFFVEILEQICNDLNLVKEKVKYQHTLD